MSAVEIEDAILKHPAVREAAAIGVPDDLKGLKMRTMENPIHIQAYKQLGILPTPMAFTEVFTALQQGTVDGQENPLSVITSAKLDQVQKNLSLTGHVYSPALILMNKGAWDKLSAADKQAQIVDGIFRYGPYAMFVLLPAFALTVLPIAYLGEVGLERVFAVDAEAVRVRGFEIAGDAEAGHRVARQAGTRHASIDTQHTITITSAYVTGSRRETPNSIAAIAELAKAAPRSPTRTPEPVSTAP